ncbi:peroxidase 5-like [Magnolia sinica]|uniref:peroxidase 5-like n=1 Tax=Magnolia sinica TaxID=86752 RepID=UPI0026591F31|nr:peroxidase 5-like [Magnolia sinica]
MKGFAVLCFIGLVLVILAVPAVGDGLRYDYYCETCPKAEVIISKMMDNFVQCDTGVPARIIRMHFHDCFVRGCDASILLNSTAHNQAERDAPANNPSLKGFDLIDQIKEALEYHCSGVVSCADIIAYAARDSVEKSGKFGRYAVRGGRKDGRISRASEVITNLPTPNFDANALIQRFASKGLSLDDMVTLSGAHSIGVSHCSSLLGRHRNFNKTGLPDPTLNFHLAQKLRSKCPSGSKVDPTIVMDTSTPTIMDNKYYEGVLENKGLFTSDHTLLTNKLTKKQVVDSAAQPSAWEKKFVKAMIKMGEIEVLTGQKGEIRRKCSFVNEKKG